MPSQAQPPELKFAFVGPAWDKVVAISPAMAAGIEAYFDYVNQAGGVRGKRLSLTRLDDGFVPERSVQLLQAAAADEALVGVAAVFGTAATLKIAESGLLERSRLVVAAATTGAKRPRELNSTQLLFFRPSYQDEVATMVRYAATLGLKRYAFFYEDSPFGADGVEALDKALAAGAGQVVARHGYKRGETDFAGPAKAFADAQPEVVILFSVQNVAANFVRDLRARGYKQHLFSISVVNPDSFVKDLGLDNAHGIAIAQVVPGPASAKVEVSRLFQRVMAQQGRTAWLGSHSALEGFMVGALVTQAVRKAKEPVTRESFAQAARTITYEKLGGTPASLDLGSQLRPKYLELGVLDRSGALRN